MSKTVAIFPQNDLKDVKIMWSEKYACPVYLVGGKRYIEDTGEYSGYFSEVKSTLKTYIASEIKEVIGEDEQPVDRDHYDTRHNWMFLENLKSVRNSLRDEQLERAKQKGYEL